MRSRFLIPASLIIATLVLLISLGFWQLDRADEKRGIEDQISSANSGDVELVTSVEFLKDKEYYHVRLQGSYVGDKQFIYDNQIVDQISGYYVLTPFILTGTSKAVLINRGFTKARTLFLNSGWVPTKGKKAKSRPNGTRNMMHNS